MAPPFGRTVPSPKSQSYRATAPSGSAAADASNRAGRPAARAVAENDAIGPWLGRTAADWYSGRAPPVGNGEPSISRSAPEPSIPNAEISLEPKLLTYRCRPSGVGVIPTGPLPAVNGEPGTGVRAPSPPMAKPCVSTVSAGSTGDPPL